MGIEFGKIFTDILGKFGGALPGIIGAFIVFLIGWIIAAIVRKAVKALLAKMGADKLAENLNRIDLFSKMSIEIKPSTFISQIVYYLLLLITMMVAAEVSGLQDLSDLMETIIEYTPKLLSALLLLIIGLVIADFIRKLIKTACDSVGIPSGSIIASFVFYFLFITVAMSALKQAGVTTDFMTTNLSIIIGGIVLAFAVGYGYASRSVMSSILSSFFYTKGKIGLGDHISINGMKGEVIEMNSTSVTIKTDKGRTVIPLRKFSEDNFEILD